MLIQELTQRSLFSFIFPLCGFHFKKCLQRKHQYVVVGIYGDQSFSSVHAGNQAVEEGAGMGGVNTNTKQSRWLRVGYKGKRDINDHAFPVASNYTVIVSMKNKMAAFVRSRWMKSKSEKKRECRNKERRVSKSAWPRKIHEAKNSICHFICDGPSEALCHMTYPSYRTRRDTSIHLFRHLTCLEQGTERKTENRVWEERRGCVVFSHILLTYTFMCHGARLTILHYFTIMASNTCVLCSWRTETWCSCSDTATSQINC